MDAFLTQIWMLYVLHLYSKLGYTRQDIKEKVERFVKEWDKQPEKKQTEGQDIGQRILSTIVLRCKGKSNKLKTLFKTAFEQFLVLSEKQIPPYEKEYVLHSDERSLRPLLLAANEIVLTEAIKKQHPLYSLSLSKEIEENIKQEEKGQEEAKTEEGETNGQDFLSEHWPVTVKNFFPLGRIAVGARHFLAARAQSPDNVLLLDEARIDILLPFLTDPEKTSTKTKRSQHLQTLAFTLRMLQDFLQRQVGTEGGHNTYYHWPYKECEQAARWLEEADFDTLYSHGLVCQNNNQLVWERSEVQCYFYLDRPFLTEEQGRLSLHMGIVPSHMAKGKQHNIQELFLLTTTERCQMTLAQWLEQTQCSLPQTLWHTAQKQDAKEQQLRNRHRWRGYIIEDDHLYTLLQQRARQQPTFAYRQEYLQGQDRESFCGYEIDAEGRVIVHWQRPKE